MGAPSAPSEGRRSRGGRGGRGRGRGRGVVVEGLGELVEGEGLAVLGVLLPLEVRDGPEAARRVLVAAVEREAEAERLPRLGPVVELEAALAPAEVGLGVGRVLLEHGVAVGLALGEVARREVRGRAVRAARLEEREAPLEAVGVQILLVGRRRPVGLRSRARPL